MIAIGLLAGCGPSLASDGESESSGTGSGATADGSSEAGSTADSSTSDTGDEAIDPCECGCALLTTAYSPPRLMFVVDTSSSMATPWDHDGDPGTPEQTRWASAQAIVAEIASNWDPYGLIGLQRFPSADACPGATALAPTCEDASACVIAGSPERPLGWFGAETIDAMPGPAATPLELAGASPAAAAYASAVEHVLARRDPDAQAFESIVLVSDGHANCSAELDVPDSLDLLDDDLLGLITAAFDDHGIHTAVIAVDEAAAISPGPSSDSIPGFDPRPTLTSWAIAGGLDQTEVGYFSVDDPEPIHQTFATPEYTGGCVVELQSTVDGLPTPAQIPLVTWTLDGEPLELRSPEACKTESGWSWWVSADVEIGEIVLFCGEACDRFNSLMQPAAFVGSYGCPEMI